MCGENSGVLHQAEVGQVKNLVIGLFSLLDFVLFVEMVLGIHISAGI